VNPRASFWALVVGVVFAVAGALLLPLTTGFATVVLILTGVLGLLVGLAAPTQGWQAVSYLLTANTLMLLALIANITVHKPLVQNLLIGLLALLGPYAPPHLFRVTRRVSNPDL